MYLVRLQIAAVWGCERTLDRRRLVDIEVNYETTVGELYRARDAAAKEKHGLAPGVCEALDERIPQSSVREGPRGWESGVSMEPGVVQAGFNGVPRCRVGGKREF